MNCGQACGTSEVKATNVDPVQRLIQETQLRFEKEGPALECVSDHETYLDMLAKAPFYVSATHCRDGETTWWAAAKDKEAYDEWEEEVEHQHHPSDEHPHYLCVNAPQYE